MRPQPPSQSAGRAGWLTFALAALIAAAVLASFWPALAAGFVNWDDDLNLTDNPAYRGLGWAELRWMWTTTLGGHYQPLTWMTFAVDHALWGMEPRGYHLTSLVLHAANALVLYALALALLRRVAPAAGERSLAVAAAAGALVFAIHPLRVESVVWVSERRDVLSGLFYLLALLAYVRMADAPDDRRTRWLGASLGCLVLSLLAKAWGMTFPLVLLVLDAYPLRRLRPGGRARVLGEKALFAVPALAAALAALGAQASVEEMRGLAEHGIGARLAQAAYGLCFYLGKTIVPLALWPAYLLESPLDPTVPRYVWSALAVGALTIGLVLARRRWPWALAAWAAYVVVVSPVLGLAQTGPQLVADRYTYLACLPWALLVAAGVLRLWPRLLPPQALAAAIATAAVVVLVVLGTLTHRQARIWQSSRTLWDHVIRHDPTNHVALTNRALVHDDVERALADLDEAIRLAPRSWAARFNRGTVWERKGDYAAALVDYAAAIHLRPRDPRAYNNRGWARQALGDWEGAARDYAHALELAGPGWQHRDLVAGNLARARKRLSGGEP